VNNRETQSRFRRLSAAGIFFQGGAAAVDSSTIIATLVYALTANTYAVGTASAISRYGWLFPQIFIAYLAQRRQKRMPFYIVGAFGRAMCLLGVAGILILPDRLPHNLTVTLFFVLWTTYAFVSGIVAVPYNDIVARSIVSERRSRLLAIRFFGGGLLALGVAAAAGRLLDSLAFPDGYAAIVALGAGLMLVSSLSFVSAGEPAAPLPATTANGFTEFLRRGIGVFRSDRRLRLFVCAQWLGGAVMMALPFYVLQVLATDGATSQVAFLLAAQTAGALVSNALWGWWGDRRGKRSLYEGVALLRTIPPLLTLLWSAMAGMTPIAPLAGFVLVFFLNGALGNGTTIAVIGYLMEISPDDQRPAYSGYFNALVAPAALLPLAGAVIVESTSLAGVFVVSLGAACVQFLIIRLMRSGPLGPMQ